MPKISRVLVVSSMLKLPLVEENREGDIQYAETG